MNEKKAKKVLTKVKKTYQNIAHEFSATRSRPGKEFELFIPYVKKDSIIVDVGCGNGRVLGYLQNKKLPNYKYLGIDNNIKFIEICKQKYPGANFLEGDMLNLTLKAEFADVALYMRSFHHIPSKKLRIKAISEINRILKNDGILMITVWNLWQRKNFIPLLKAFLRSIFTFGTYEFNDTFIKWGKKNKRYYHAFTLRELMKLLRQQNFKILHQEKNKDIIIIAQKKS